MSGHYFVYIIGSMLLSLGAYGLLASSNLMKKIISLNIMQSSVILLYVLLGFKSNGASPVYREGVSLYVNPLPQVLMLTAIVVGLAVSAVGYALVLKIHKLFGTINSHAVDEKCFYDASYKKISEFQEHYVAKLQQQDTSSIKQNVVIGNRIKKQKK